MFKKLDPKDKHTNCQYCNYLGCDRDNLIHHIKFTTWLRWSKFKKKIKKSIHNLGALDYSKIDDAVVSNVDIKDYPDFCDAFIESATYKGRDMTEKELERLNEDYEYIYELACDEMF